MDDDRIEPIFPSIVLYIRDQFQDKDLQMSMCFKRVINLS